MSTRWQPCDWGEDGPQRLFDRARPPRSYTDDEILELAYEDSHLTADQLLGYRDQAVDAEDRQEVERHLAECDFCVWQLRELCRPAGPPAAVVADRSDTAFKRRTDDALGARVLPTHIILGEPADRSPAVADDTGAHQQEAPRTRRVLLSYAVDGAISPPIALQNSFADCNGMGIVFVIRFPGDTTLTGSVTRTSEGDWLTLCRCGPIREILARLQILVSEAEIAWERYVVFGPSAQGVRTLLHLPALVLREQSWQLAVEFVERADLLPAEAAIALREGYEQARSDAQAALRLNLLARGSALWAAATAPQSSPAPRDKVPAVSRLPLEALSLASWQTWAQAALTEPQLAPGVRAVLDDLVKSRSSWWDYFEFADLDEELHTCVGDGQLALDRAMTATGDRLTPAAFDTNSVVVDATNATVSYVSSDMTGTLAVSFSVDPNPSSALEVERTYLYSLGMTLWAGTVLDRPAARSRRLPLVGCSRGEGRVVWLDMELLNDGSGKCYPGSHEMARVPMSPEFLAESRTAWHVCSALFRGESAHSESAPAEGLPFDVRWRLTGLPGACVLAGQSFGAAMAVGLLQLLRDEPLDSRCAILGTLSPDGRLEPVGRVSDKVRAVFAVRDPEPDGITRVIVSPLNQVEARSAAARTGRDPTQAVRVARTVGEAYAEATGKGAPNGTAAAPRFVPRTARALEPDRCCRISGTAPCAIASKTADGRTPTPLTPVLPRITGHNGLAALPAGGSPTEAVPCLRAVAALASPPPSRSCTPVMSPGPGVGDSATMGAPGVATEVQSAELALDQLSREVFDHCYSEDPRIEFDPVAGQCRRSPPTFGLRLSSYGREILDAVFASAESWP